MKFNVFLGCSALVITLLLITPKALSHSPFSGVFPPDPPTAEEAEKGHQKMQQERARLLGLTPEQSQKIAQLEKTFFDSHRAQMEQMRLDHRQLKSRIEAILTPEQKAKIQALPDHPSKSPFKPPPLCHLEGLEKE
jgi:Spy/CpxP family protein refolding chaperone